MVKKKVLIIDDSQTIILFQKLILGTKYELISATSGELGLAAAKKEKPDLILLDIVMPEMDGIKVLTALKESTTTKAIPVLMVTTKSEEDRVETCYRLGCADYVTKPIDKVDLLSKVQKYLS